ASTENSAYQKTKNPVDPGRVPGGSSGGSAAAVAGGMAVWALGSDTGGSIRQPASFCGIVGLKPTYGRVSRHGLIAMASSLDQIGPIAETVEDAAIILSRISGEDNMDATSAESGGKSYEDFLIGDIKGAVIGVPKEYFGNDLDEKIKNISFEALKKFKELGAVIKEIEIPAVEYALPVYYIIVPSEVSSNMARYDGIRYGLSVDNNEKSGINPGNLLETYLDTRQVGLGDEVKRRIMLGTYTLSAGYYDAYYKKAQKVRNLLKKDFEEIFKKVDFIFSPTAPEPAFKFGDKTDDPLKMYLSDVYTVVANLIGVPAISFPIGSIEENGKNLPVGGQIMGRWFDEEGILNLAHTFEINKKK
ncbi:MAG: amidase family protein, partial [Candidatus Moranbacteria bacterium]|nr:amidase family protein [Candidatus Moranbacteria bacterium]